VLCVVVARDELIDAIKTQFDRDDLLEGANESAVFLGPVVIGDGGRTIDLRMADGLGAASRSCPPNARRCSVGETKQVEGDDRPAKPGKPSYFECNMTMSSSTSMRWIVTLLLGSARFLRQIFQSGSSINKI